MKFKIEFLDRDLADNIVEAEDLDALKKMYLSGKLDGDEVNNGTEEEPEKIRITEMTV